MRKFLGSKKGTLVLGGISLLAVVYLTAALASFQFRPTESLPGNAPSSQQQSTLGLQAADLPLDELIGAAVLLLVVLAVVVVLLDRKQRPKFLKVLLRLVLLGAAVYLLASHFGPRDLVTEMKSTEVAPPPVSLSDTGAQVQAAPFLPPALPDWAIYLIGLGLLLALGGAAWLVFWLRGRRKPEQSFEALAAIANAGLQALQGGADWENTIVQCYQRMSAVVNARRRLARQPAVTPREFAGELQRAGLPGEAVRRLTTLFECVRYGEKSTSRGEIDEAVACLTAILQACQETV